MPRASRSSWDVRTSWNQRIWVQTALMEGPTADPHHPVRAHSVLIQQCCSLVPAHQILSYHDQQVIHPAGHHYWQQRGASAGGESRRLGHPGSQQHVVMGGSVDQYPSAINSMGDCCSGLLQRVNFASPDPSQYDASINLQDVQISDSATYECKVKKTTVATRKVTITVLGESASLALVNLARSGLPYVPDAMP